MEFFVKGTTKGNLVKFWIYKIFVVMGSSYEWNSFKWDSTVARNLCPDNLEKYHDQYNIATYSLKIAFEKWQSMGFPDLVTV